MTEDQYRILINFGWNEKDIKGRLLRDQIKDLNFDFIWRLDNAISDAKSHHGKKDGQFIIYDFTLDVHSPKGYHPRGRAADGSFYNLDLFETFIILDRWRFGGIGLYLDTKPDQMIHVDDRNHYRSSRWVRIDGDYVYSPIFFMETLEGVYLDSVVYGTDKTDERNKK